MSVLHIDTTDFIVLVLVCIGTLAYFTKGWLWAVEAHYDPKKSMAMNGYAKKSSTRNILEKMETSDKNAVVFYGSQTGTAEDYANRLAKEGHSRFGLRCMTADLEDYDYENLDMFPEDQLAIFILATYGEGEPTDNAVEFTEFITGEDSMFSNGEGIESSPLKNLQYAAFGLGNNTYEKYNEMVRRIDAALLKLGAQRIGKAGEGDDGSGTMEEDFLAWKEEMWGAVQQKMGLEEREPVYEAALSVSEDSSLSPEDPEVYIGEPNKQHLNGGKGPYHAHNPFVAPVRLSKELFTVKNRNCIHMEIDLTGSGMKYVTGDHLAVWPTNAGLEVDRFLRVLGLLEKRHTVVHVRIIDVTAKIPFPTPTTYDAIARYYLEICGAVSRQLLGQIAVYAPNEKAKSELARLGADKDAFSDEIVAKSYNFAQVLEYFGGGDKWSDVPFSFIIESINHIVPRYYSISSSSMKCGSTAHITAVVESVPALSGDHILKGVTTNYLLALKQSQHGDPEPDPHGKTYAIKGPRNRYDGHHVPVHVRHSNFKLPTDPTRPIILIGPGTGVAPLRAFVMERATRKANGETVGKTVLFFGCRRQAEDFLYQEDWIEFKKILGDDFELITAFSRDGPKKVYVQDRMKELASEINLILEKQSGYIYVCGDAANMAREVNGALVGIIAKERSLTEAASAEILKSMRNANLYQEDCW